MHQLRAFQRSVLNWCMRSNNISLKRRLNVGRSSIESIVDIEAFKSVAQIKRCIHAKAASRELSAKSCVSKRRSTSNPFLSRSVLKPKYESFALLLYNSFSCNALLRHFLAAHHLNPRWLDFQKKHPELVGEVRPGRTADVVKSLLAGQVDIGLCFSPLKHPELVMTELHRGRLLPVVRKGHPLRTKAPASWDGPSCY